MAATMKMSLAFAALLTIATPAWSQEDPGELEEQARQALDSATEKADAVAEAVDSNEKECNRRSAG